MAKTTYPKNPDIGLKVGPTFRTHFSQFGTDFYFNVRSKSEENIAKGCLMYYKSMWDMETIPYSIGSEDTVVDIGAHVGFFTIPIATQVHQVVSYEPSPANFSLLERNIRQNHSANVIAVHAAIGPTHGMVNLNLGIYGTTGHTISGRKLGGVSVQVECFTLEEVVSKFNPTVLKMDCEGAEWDILSDTKPLKHINVIVAELHKVDKHSLPKLLKDLRKSGFHTLAKSNSWFTKLIAYK